MKSTEGLWNGYSFGQIFSVMAGVRAVLPARCVFESIIMPQAKDFIKDNMTNLQNSGTTNFGRLMHEIV